MADEINTSIGDNPINVVVGTDTINVSVGGGQVVANFVPADTSFRFNGSAGNTYFKYNSTTSRLELWVNGSKVREWS